MSIMEFFFDIQEKKISELEEYKKFSEDIDYLTMFFESLSDLPSGNNSFIAEKSTFTFDKSLIENASKTLKSIKLCCSIGSFSDANTLLRRFRDDLLLYVYALEIISKRKPFLDEDLSKLDFNDPQFINSFLNMRLNSNWTDDEKIVEAWLGNTISEHPKLARKKLCFKNYMDVLKANEHIADILENYNLQTYWETLTGRLNDYVHNNGIKVAYQNLTTAKSKDVDNQLKNIVHRASFVSSFFLILILITQSSLISSTDYMDHLEADLEPPDGSQYFVAPFIQEFIDLKVAKLHPEIKQYLKDHNINGMQID